ncbi:MAG: leucine-rich repeat protein [Clostridia bacterium]|nr:leucine-rich repeat protein [Clostridia bacterium]
MKKNILRSLLLVILALSIVMALASCEMLENLLPGVFPGGECEHVDADGDKLCDKCEAELEGYEPDDPIDPDDPLDPDDVPDLSGIVFADKTVIYSGDYHELSIPISEIPVGVVPLYSLNKFVEVGSHTVTVDFYYAGEKIEGASKSATLTIEKASYDLTGVSLPGLTKTYDGKAVELSVEGKLPGGVSVEKYVYKNAAGEDVDEIVDAGVYTAYAVLKGNSTNFHPITPLEATVEVRRLALSGYSFKDAKLEYDGTPKSIFVEGLPSDVKVTYTGNGQIDYGTYTVTASFDVGVNYEPIADMTATLRITKLLYDMDGVSLSGATVTYDGTSKMPTLEGSVPAGVSVSYTVVDEDGNEVNEVVNVGTYTVTASFEVGSDYEPIEPMTATVVVRKASVSVSFKDVTFGFDGTEKSILVEGLPSFVEATYEGNGRIAPGVYKVTVTFAASDNYNALEPMTATMTISFDNPQDYPTETLTYEKVTGGYAVTGITNSPMVVVIPSRYLGEPVVSVKSNAFRGMDFIEYLYIPASVTNIGNAAFMDCSKLATLYLAGYTAEVDGGGNIVKTGTSALKTIGQLAFANTALKVVDLPDSLVAMGIGVFEGCKEIEKMTLPFIGGSANSSHPYLGYLFGANMAESSSESVPASLTTLIISDNCKEIPAYAFYGITSLKSVHVGKSVVKIGNRAFAGCSALRDIYLPKSVTTIPAATSYTDSPFFGCAEDLLIVIESIESTSGFGRYYASVSETGAALVIFGKTYEDYCMNKDNYRAADVTDSKAAGIYVGGKLVDGFDPAKLDYSVSADINKGFGAVTAIANSSLASISVTNLGGNKIAVAVTSADGVNTTTYTISVTVTGSFSSAAEVVNKNGASGTVSFVLDDGFIGTANFAKSMLDKYPSLSLTFAIYTSKIATFKMQDTNGDGIMEYVKDANGRYVYETDMIVEGSTQKVVDFWRDILSSTPGRTEIVSHSHTHRHWGYDDRGGSMFAIANSNGNISKSPTTLAEGSVSAEMYGSIQIVQDLFGDLGSMSETFVMPGIAVTGSTKATKSDVNILLRGHLVRLVSDTAVSTTGTTDDSGRTKYTVNSATEIDLASVKLTIPAGTPIATNAEISGNVIPKGTVIAVVECSMTVPAGTQILGHGTYWNKVKDEALASLTYIGSRNTGASDALNNGIYQASFFANIAKRKDVKSFGIKAEDVNRDISDWKGYIDSAVERKGWVSYCIHAITETLNSAVENQGGHMITFGQGEELFKHAVEYGDELWIAQYSDATMYYHEWSTSKVTHSYDAATGRITVSLTDNENDEIYTMPLTIKVKVPATWASATDGTNTYEIRKNSDGSAYVYVDVKPETTVTITGN